MKDPGLSDKKYQLQQTLRKRCLQHPTQQQKQKHNYF